MRPEKDAAREVGDMASGDGGGNPWPMKVWR